MKHTKKRSLQEFENSTNNIHELLKTLLKNALSFV